MRILLTNDDGIAAPGLRALHQAARSFGEVHVVAPSTARSACGHAVTFHRPLEAWPEPVLDEQGEVQCTGTAVSGKPADCVKVALTRLLDEPVDLVLSGINAGCNVGVHTLYSGTVAAAREAALAGVSAVSVSLHVGRWDAIRWDRAAELASDCLSRILAAPLPARTFLNVNIPILDDGREPRGIRVAPASNGAMVDAYLGEAREGGRIELTVARQVLFHEMPKGSDTALLFDGYLTISPLTVELTDRSALDLWRDRLA